MVIVGLERPTPGGAFRLKCLFGWRVTLSFEREIWEPLLCNVRVFVLLVRTERVKCLNTDYSNNPTKNVGLLKINVNEFSRTVLDVFNRLSEVTDLKRRW